MQDIIFRVYNKKTNKMYDMAYVVSDGEMCVSHDFIHECESGLPIDLAWMQYTGLKDKNRNIIYDGDIIQFGKTNYHVRWNFNRWIMFDKEFDGHDGFGMPLVGPSFSKNKMHNIKIIGNIYQGAHLLEE